MTGWIASKIWRKIILRAWGGGGGGGGGVKCETEHRIWGIVWLVGVYCESDGPRK